MCKQYERESACHEGGASVLILPGFGPPVHALTFTSFLCKLTSLVKGHGEMVELAEGTGLENRRGCKSSAGSNPALSAKYPYNALIPGRSYFKTTKSLLDLFFRACQVVKIHDRFLLIVGEKVRVRIKGCRYFCVTEAF